MKQVSSAEFRKEYTHETEPVEVTAYGKVIGTYYPHGTKPELTAPESTSAPEEAPVPRFSIRPAHGPRPAVVATTKPVLDPLEMRKRERERWSELQAKMYGKRKG